MEIEVFEEIRKNRIVPATSANPEPIKYFYFDEYTRLIAGAKPYYRLVYLLYFETGARCEEGRMARFSDLDLNQNKLRLQTLKRKKNTWRVIPISDSLKAAILQHRIENNLTDTDFILTKSSGCSSVKQQSFDEKMKADCTRLGIDIKKGHIHTWRHTRAIQLLDVGIPINTVQKFLGHSSITNTLIYLQYSSSELQKAVKEANLSIGLK